MKLFGDKAQRINEVGTVNLEESMRLLAQCSAAEGRAVLRVGRQKTRRLKSALERFGDYKYIFENQDGAFQKFRSESGSIEGLLSRAEDVCKYHLPAVGDEVRILSVARTMIDSGEQRLDRERILRSMRAFMSVRSLEIFELLSFPDALAVAASEVLEECCQIVLEYAEQRRNARIWVNCGGKGRLRGKESAVFLEQALRCAEEAENTKLHSRIVEVIASKGDSAVALIERVHRATSQLSMRAENLMSLWHLLRRMDWQECYEELSETESELRRDPGGIYPAMDKESRSEIRRLISGAAQELRVEEQVIVKTAHRAAMVGCKAYGASDPRATICYYLADNDGRDLLSSRVNVGRKLRRLVPDPGGRRTAALLAGLTLALAALFAAAADHTLLAVYMLPLAWVLTVQLIARFYPFFIKPRRLLRMYVDKVSSDARTLVVLPVLLSGEGRAQEMIERMEVLGCLEKDENIDFMLLADFADSQNESEADDSGIIQTVLGGIEGLNRRAGREKYFYLHRGREYREQDGKWMGCNRKRGAVRALNALILNRPAAKEAFTAENSCAEKIAAAQYRYVVTLDADTAYIPGTIQRLLGAMLHPLNRRCEINLKKRGYAVLQPAMQLKMQPAEKGYAALVHGRGGMDSYPLSISDFYQDVCGAGGFSGKGIYDVRHFFTDCEGRLREDMTLSHDLAEGILSGSGMLGDIFFYEDCPTSHAAELARSHRWIRGDWQNAYLIFSSLPLRLLDRIRLAGNLLRSLYAPMLLVLLLHAAWLGDANAFALGIALAFAPALLNPVYSGKRGWRSALFRLAVLPAEAKCALDAVLRTLWRTIVSKKKLMEWTTSADAVSGERSALWGRIAAVLLFPAVLRPGWIAQTIALAALFWVGGPWAEDLSRMPAVKKDALSAKQLSLLNDAARRTWHFFEYCVPEDGNGLPPDNLQIDPPVGTADRTSPTNIALYILSCISAYELGFIERDVLLKRVSNCVSTVEKMEKWRGQLYNWYDTRTLEALRPRYVSSVDSGNLAAALLLAAKYLENMDAAQADALRLLAENMDFTALYDAEADLFRIGADIESGALSHAHYDLYASESRILSFAAMMLGQVPVKHWRRLNRAQADFGARHALVSWSGTMFEYLMPEIFMRSHPDSLAGASSRNVALMQAEFGRRAARPWGISESGYYAFDMHLNYQYRAFGLKALSLSGNTAQDVVAPYASALALCVCPNAAAENLLRMREMGWWGEYGYYEAADYLKTEENGHPRIVKSHMAHHQGMLLCAVCNALCGDALAQCFMSIPEAQALKLLLDERTDGYKRSFVRRKAAHEDRPLRLERSHRNARPDRYSVDTHILSGGGTTALLNGRGGAYLWHKGIQMNRFSGDLSDIHEGMYVHIGCADRAESRVMGSGGQVRFDLGCAELTEEVCGVHAQMKIAVSPENGAVIHAVELENGTDEERDMQLTACFAAALAPQADMRAHPVFQNLFIEFERISDTAVLMKRRSRTPEKQGAALVFAVYGAEGTEMECDMEKLAGRSGALGMSGGISAEFSGIRRNSINPCGALRANVHLMPGESRKIHFALSVTDGENTEKLLRKLCCETAPERAIQLAATQVRAALQFEGIHVCRHQLLQRGAALLFDARLQADQNRSFDACEAAPKELLWRAGISGELPVICVDAEDVNAAKCLREIIRMHGFYRMHGIWADLVIINSHGNDYQQPLRDTAADMIACSHLGELRNCAGGVYLIDRQHADRDVVRAVERAAAMLFSGKSDAYAQLERMLDVLDLPRQAEFVPMQPQRLPADEKLKFDNGYGGFSGGGYLIRMQDGALTPAPWSNIAAEGESGAVLTERCGGFAWSGNSRAGRLTAFSNDVLHEGWGWMFYAVDRRRQHFTRLLPGSHPMTDFTAFHTPGMSRFTGESEGMRFSTAVRPQKDGIEFEIQLENRSEKEKRFVLCGFVDWLMGTDESDRRMLRTWSRMGACFASGAMQGVGYFACDDPHARTGASRREFLAGGDMMQPLGLMNDAVPQGGWVLEVPARILPGERIVKRFVLGAGKTAALAYEAARNFGSAEIIETEENWRREMQKLRIETPSEALNLLANGFLQSQAYHGRILAKTGLYQPGGAFGFRDQLQDMLLMIHYRPELVRSYLLKCASRQFAAGDVLHWWHEPAEGVRTHISDDKLFLPYVTAQYVRITGDEDILSDNAPFLQDVEIPEGREDVYARMQPSDQCATLHEHCMRAFRSALKTGKNGLLLMGSGDWNDGMNRVGAQGRGESIWLTEFAAVCAKEYAEIVQDEGERAWLLAMNEQLCAAVEEKGWDGEWYLRAYADDGRKLGSGESISCRIDIISQAWAVFAGLNSGRVKRAMAAAWNQLVDEKEGIIRLLAPAFDGKDFDPGYIAAYPGGIRENGAQYTHAACWYGCALAEMGDAARAHRVLDMLLPVRHAQTAEEAERYCVEPYVMAADVYANPHYAGRGGWTWYTGSAQWMMQFVLSLFGYERRKNRVRIRALLGSWESASISLRFGSSEYVLTADAAAKKIMLDGQPVEGEYIVMKDDGCVHHALFPPKNTDTAEEDEILPLSAQTQKNITKVQ